MWKGGKTTDWFVNDKHPIKCVILNLNEQRDKKKQTTTFFLNVQMIIAYTNLCVL